MPASIHAPLAVKVLDTMPGMTGAIDNTFRDQTGERVSFVLVAFIEGAAIHATNIEPAENAILALTEMCARYATDQGGEDVSVSISK